MGLGVGCGSFPTTENMLFSTARVVGRFQPVETYLFLTLSRPPYLTLIINLLLTLYSYISCHGRSSTSSPYPHYPSPPPFTVAVAILQLLLDGCPRSGKPQNAFKKMGVEMKLGHPPLGKDKPETFCIIEGAYMRRPAGRVQMESGSPVSGCRQSDWHRRSFPLRLYQWTTGVPRLYRRKIPILCCRIRCIQPLSTHCDGWTPGYRLRLGV